MRQFLRRLGPYLKDYKGRIALSFLGGLIGAGAYGAVQSGTYNTRPLVAEVLVKGDRYAVVRPRQTLDELIGLDRFASWQDG